MKHSVILSNIRFFLIMTILTGFLYPLAMTVLSHTLFPFQADGSLIKSGISVRGSFLFGQDFADDKYFHCRPSVCRYDPMNSLASNLSGTSAQLKETVRKRRLEWQKTYGNENIPGEMLHASGSGLDPDISPDAAFLQINRISKARKFNGVQAKELVMRIKKITEKQWMSVPRVNVTELNLLLDTDPAFRTNF